MGVSLVLLISCDAPPSDVSEARGSVPKADLIGSCEGACGGQASGTCWCDAACELYGDCCSDKTDICDVQEECELEVSGQATFVPVPTPLEGISLSLRLLEHDPSEPDVPATAVAEVQIAAGADHPVPFDFGAVSLDSSKDYFVVPWADVDADGVQSCGDYKAGGAFEVSPAGDCDLDIVLVPEVCGP